MDEITDRAKVLTLTDDLERTIEQRVNLLFDFVKVFQINGVFFSFQKLLSWNEIISTSEIILTVEKIYFF